MKRETKILLTKLFHMQRLTENIFSVIMNTLNSAQEAKERAMRRYMDFLYGNTQSKESLLAAVEKDAFPHALIIEGASGSGKKTFAKGLAAAQFCENRFLSTHPLPCGNCRNCRVVEEGNALDVKWITKGDKATLGVDAVREAKHDMFLSATEFDYKFYIFDEAHLMTPQAQNALLIVLEEPPPKVKIMLLCESADALLTTVRSRARLVKMSKFSTDSMRNYLMETHPLELKNFTSDEENLNNILTEADGSIGKALTLLSPKNAEALLKEKETIISLIDAFSSPSFAKLHTAFSKLSTKRDELTEDLENLSRALRDLILLKKSGDAPLCFFGNRETAQKTAARFRLPVLLRAIEITDDAVRKLERNANAATVLNLLQCSFKNG